MLEIGCGTGGNLKYLFSDFGTRTGLEFNPEAAQYARQKGENFTVVEGDANVPPFDDAEFDCVALLDVLYHQKIKNVDALLEHVHRMLKPRGVVLVTDGAYDFLASKHSKAVESARRFTKPGLTNHLVNQGFQINKASYWGTGLFFPLFAKRVIFDRLFPSKDEQHESYDLVQVPVVDSLLYASIVAEIPLLRLMGLPFGASICALAQKV